MNSVPKIISLIIIGVLTWLTILVPLLIIIKLKPQIAVYYAFLPVFIIIYFLLTCKNDKCISNLASLIFRKASLFGSIGLVGGFINQIFFAPSSIEGQGFLWPFLFTMPLGVLVGIFWGFVQWFIVEKKDNYLKSLFQSLIIFLVILMSHFFLKMVTYFFIPYSYNLVRDIISLIFAFTIGWIAWKEINTEEKNLLSNTVLGAVILGGTGVALGMYGSILINPRNEQAIFGVFIFGLPGFMIGAMLGAIMGKSKTWTSLLQICVIVSVSVVIGALIRLAWHDSKYSSYIQHPSDLQIRNNTLKKLHVSRLSDNELIKLKRFKYLYSLDFSAGGATYQAKLTDVGLKNLSEMKLPNLRSLILNHCRKISDEGMKYIARIRTLKNVSLRSNAQITDVGLAYLAASKSIEEIDLRDCTGITDEGLLVLKKMPRLQKLKLGGNTNITEAGIKRFSPFFPYTLNAKPGKTIQDGMTLHTNKVMPPKINRKTLYKKEPPSQKLYPDKLNSTPKKTNDKFHYSAWAKVTPELDGVISAGEWDDADRSDITWRYTLNQYNGNESHDVICLLKNDATYLYIALIIKNDDWSPSAYSIDSISIQFSDDINSSFVLEKKHGDDIITVNAVGQVTDAFYDSTHPARPDGGWYPTSDLNDGGTKDVDAAASHSNPGFGNIGDYVFELRHPWHSSDKEHDIHLYEGDTIAFFIKFFDLMSNGGNVQPRFPNTGIGKITIMSKQ